LLVELIPIEASGVAKKKFKINNNVNEYLQIGKSNAPPVAKHLLKMRDGPRGRAPATRFAMGYGLVTLNQKTSVPLCGFSVNSVVKEILNHRERGEDTENAAVNAPNPTKTFRTNCIPKDRDKLENGRLQEEKSGLEGSNALMRE